MKRFCKGIRLFCGISFLVMLTVAMASSVLAAGGKLEIVSSDNIYLAGDFSEGLCNVYSYYLNAAGNAVEIESKYIDKNFDIAISLSPGELGGEFSDGVAFVYHYGELESFGGSDMKPTSIYVIDKTGSKLFTLPKGHSGTKFSEGLALITYKNGNDKDRFYFVDVKGETLIDFPDIPGTTSMSVRSFSDGLAKVVYWDDSQITYYIDKTGEKAVRLPDGHSGDDFSEGLAFVTYWHPEAINQNYEARYIDKGGNTVIDLLDSHVGGVFSEGLAYISYKYGEGLYIDKTGETVITLPEGHSGKSFHDGLALVDGPSPYYIDYTGAKWTIDHTGWDHVSDFSSFSDGYALAFVAGGDGSVFLKHPGNLPVRHMASDPTIKIEPTSSSVHVNDVKTAFEAYNIGGNNFFKLRDLAYALNRTQKTFSVGYDSKTKAITLTTGEYYTPVGGEMVIGDSRSKTAAPTESTVYLDGRSLELTVYNIDGNNYFKLRDIMKLLDVAVTYDSSNGDVKISTSTGYTDE